MSPSPIVRRAHGSTDDEARERELGLELVARLQGLLRAAKMYDPSNQAYQHQLQEMLTVLARTTDDETTLVSMGDSFYVNGTRLRAQASQIGLFRALQEEFQSRGLGALRFFRGLEGDELTGFLKLFVATRNPGQGGRLPETVAEAGILRVLPVRAGDLRSAQPQTPPAEAEEARDERARARETFHRAVRGIRGILLRAARTGKPVLRQARHVVQPIVDSIMKNEFSILGLTALKEHDEYTYAHCVNVSLLSVAMGQVLGLSRSPLANLGVAALLHDLGKIAVPTEILRKSGTLSPDEWASVRRHPLEGVKLITHVPGLSVMTLDAMWVNLQHHMNVDGSGYPTLAGPRPLKSLARVVSVADCFDALTAHRAYRPRAFTGHEALQQMAGPDRAHFDPAALWALVRSVGLYPAGSVLLTASGYRVLSLSPNRADLWRPYCRVLQRPDGSRPDTRSPETWDPMPATERVARALTPEECPVKVAPLLAA